MNLKFIHDTERQQIFKESLFNWFHSLKLVFTLKQLVYQQQAVYISGFKFLM